MKKKDRKAYEWLLRHDESNFWGYKMQYRSAMDAGDQEMSNVYRALAEDCLNDIKSDLQLMYGETIGMHKYTEILNIYTLS